MSTMYATVTSKGQVTLPVELRRALGIEPGQTVCFHQTGDQVVFQVPDDIEATRAKLERAAKRNGTWGRDATERSWEQAAVRRYADS